MDMEFRALVLAGVLVVSACVPASSEAVATAGTDAAEGMPDSTLDVRMADGLRVDAGDIGMHLAASRCEAVSDGLLACGGGVRLDVSMPRENLRQVLNPATAMVKDDALAYRGPLPADARPEPHTIVISDVNGDGHEDLLLWSGLEGAYGGPSFDVYLFDRQARELRHSQAFSDLTVGYTGLFGVNGTRITTDARSGCCTRIHETWSVRNDEPELVERITTGGEPGDATSVRERLVDGEMRRVDTD